MPDFSSARIAGSLSIIESRAMPVLGSVPFVAANADVAIVNKRATLNILTVFMALINEGFHKLSILLD